MIETDFSGHCSTRTTFMSSYPALEQFYPKPNARWATGYASRRTAYFGKYVRTINLSPSGSKITVRMLAVEPKVINPPFGSRPLRAM